MIFIATSCTVIPRRAGQNITMALRQDKDGSSMMLQATQMPCRHLAPASMMQHHLPGARACLTLRCAQLIRSLCVADPGCAQFGQNDCETHCSCGWATDPDECVFYPDRWMPHQLPPDLVGE